MSKKLFNVSHYVTYGYDAYVWADDEQEAWSIADSHSLSDEYIGSDFDVAECDPDQVNLHGAIVLGEDSEDEDE